MSWVIVGAIALTGLFFSALYSGAETGFYCAARARLHLGAQRNDPRALRLRALLEDRQAALGLTLVGTNVMNYATTTAVAYMFAGLAGMGEADTELYTILFLTPVVFVFAEVVPKSLFQRHPNLLLLRCHRVLAGTHQLLRITGILWCVRQLTLRVTALVDPGSATSRVFDPRQRVAALLQEALAGRGVGDDQSYLVDRVVQLSQTPIHVVMVPRNRVVTIANQADRRELVRVARKTSHARLPVYAASKDHIIGVAVIDDLLAMEEFVAVGDHVQPVATLSPHDTVATAIGRIQKTGRNMVVVTDRGGRMLGVVTLSGLLEEVLGELAAGDDA